MRIGLSKSERVTARAVNLIVALTSFAVMAIGAYRNNVLDIKLGAMAVIYSCIAQVVLWESNYKEVSADDNKASL